MNCKLTITSSGQLKKVESIIFDTVFNEDIKVHILNLGHCCDSSQDFNTFIENEHPHRKCINVAPQMMEEFIGLNVVLRTNSRKEFHFYCPICDLVTSTHQLGNTYTMQKSLPGETTDHRIFFLYGKKCRGTNIMHFKICFC